MSEHVFAEERVELEQLRMHHHPHSGVASGGSPDGWHNVGPVPGHQLLKFTFLLKLRNLDQLQEKLMQVSQPDSPLYGQYWTRDQVNGLVAPAPASRKAVLDWVLQYPTVQVLSNGLAVDNGMIQVRMEAQVAEIMLQTRFHFFRQEETDKVVARASNFRYSVPQSLAQHLEMVAGVVRLPQLSRMHLDHEFAAVQEQAAAATVLTTPELIRRLYNVTIAPEEPRNLQAIVSFLDQFVNFSDLDQFLAQFDPPVRPVEKTIGPNDVSKPGVEAALDIQYLMGITHNIRTWIWSTAGLNEFNQEPFMEWLHNVTSSPEIPYVFSISYQDLEDTLGAEYMRRVDVEFQKLGLRGVTLFTGSGDWGVGNLTAADGSCFRFRSDFPSSSPHIISAGATFVVDETLREHGVTFSSGGFSDVFPRPSWQEKAVSNFLLRTKTPTRFFNPNGRGFPDVAAVGTLFQVVVNGRVQNVGGTSASTPTIASLLSMINSYRLKAGKPVLGFANPFLYAMWEKNFSAFQDITVGNNKFGVCPGFDCTTGWDPMTGVGVPNWAVLNFSSLDPEIFPHLPDTH